MTFHITADHALLDSVLTQPRLWRAMVNDGAPPREQFKSAPGDYIPILCHDEHALMGLFLLVPGKGYAEVHLCFLPSAWGKVEQAGREFIQWAWDVLPFRRLIALAPSYNKLVLRLAKAVGFSEFGSRPSGQTRSGKPFDLLLLEIERPSL